MTGAPGAAPSPPKGEVLTPFDEDFLRKLEMLSLLSKRLLSGQFKAERRARKMGSGLEFADYRGYVPGDDFRSVDWRAYLRLDKLILRLFEEETDLPIYILLDCSRSMGVGGEPKLAYAQKVAAALAYMGLSSLDRVSMVAFGDGIRADLPAQHGKGQIFKIFRFLAAQRAAGPTNAADAFQQYFGSRRRRGLVVVVSDFFDLHGYAPAFDVLRYRKQDMLAIHIVSPQDVSPKVNGEVTLIDSETHGRHDWMVTPALRQAYREEFLLYCAEIQRYCTLYGFGYVRTVTDFPFDDLILRVFRQGRFLA